MPLISRLKTRLRVPGLPLALLVAPAAVTVTTLSWAQAPTVIAACYPKPLRTGRPGSGVVYRINKPVGSAPSAPAACDPNDVEFSWNQLGPAGPAGAQGIPGPTGQAGAAGAQGSTGVAGPAGPAGPNGAPGATGTPGARGVSGYEFQQEIFVTLPPGESTHGQYCPGGKSVLSGGQRLESGDASAVHFAWSTPIDGGPGWFWRIVNTSPSAISVSFYTLCASVAP